MRETADRTLANEALDAANAISARQPHPLVATPAGRDLEKAEVTRAHK